MLQTPFYDPKKTYEENFKTGPFGAFADGKVYKNSGEPKVEFLGQKVFSDFGIPAGPLVNGKFVKAALDKGFDIATYKTVRSRQYPCHPWPNVVGLEVKGSLTFEQAEEGLVVAADYREPLSITNSFGVPSFDPDFWQRDLADAASYAKSGQVVIGSFQGTPKGDGDTAAYIKDFAHTARLAKETGIKILEVNLSCPNEGSAHLLCFDLERTQKVIDAIKNEIGNTPLVIKIAYYQDTFMLKKLISMVGKMVEGIESINTIGAKILDNHGNQYLPGEGRLKSGVCGAAIRWAGLSMVKHLKDLREKYFLQYRILGVGGVMAEADYKDYKQAGANAVLSATGAMWNSFLAQEVKKVFL